MRAARAFTIRTTIAISIVFLFIIAATVLSHEKVSAFQAGRIIDDAVFFDPNGMSAADIQKFLNAKVPVCDTNGTQPYAGTTRAAYGTSQGYPPPYTCLRGYIQNVPSHPADELCKAVSGGVKSAVWIIYDVAKSCGVNPQALLVLLQKEQSLVTDDWPWSRQYRSATGYGCPDTAPCDAQYYGFGNQVYQAARAFKRYAKYPQWYNYRAGRNNTILWHPNAACGSSTVYIQNKATAGLYTYTPYRPNQAALNAGWGLGNSCSSYGNRNFWLYFRLWFGTTHTNGYVARFDKQSSYPPPVFGGQSKTVYLQYRNSGSARWYDSSSAPEGIAPVRLAATKPINRYSPFSYTWATGGRPNLNFSSVYKPDGTTLASNQHVVEPGQYARFEFKLTAPYGIAPGKYREHFQPILEGASNWSMNSGLAWFDVKVLPAHKAQLHSQSSYFSIRKNTAVWSTLQYKNVGSAAWYDDESATGDKKPVHLATVGPFNRRSRFGAAWPNRKRPNLTFSKVYEADGKTLASNQHVVQPGQIARFDFKMTAATAISNGGHREMFQPILEGGSPQSMGGIAWFNINVLPTAVKAQFHAQSSYPTLSPGQSTAAFLQYKNVGNVPWYDDDSRSSGIFPIRLAATRPINRYSIFSHGWPTRGRPNLTFSKVYEADGKTLASNQHVVQPGQIARFDFNLTAPWGIKTGKTREYFQPVLEGAPNWGIGGLAWWNITIQ